jgi:competence protein ComEA
LLKGHVNFASATEKGRSTMKNLISAAVLSLVFAGPAFAQEAKPVVPAAPAPAVSAPAAAAAPAVVAPKPAAAASAAAPAASAAAGKAVDAVKSAAMPAAKPATPVAATPAVVPAKAVPAKKLVNINTATAAELDALPQIGEARTKAIIAGRPYKSVDELATKAKLPANAIDAIKGLVATK